VKNRSEHIAENLHFTEATKFSSGAENIQGGAEQSPHLWTFMLLITK